MSINKQKIYQTSPVLHHYTGYEGLMGILGENCIWATYFRNLNDSSEASHLNTRLHEALYPEFEREFRKILASFSGSKYYEIWAKINADGGSRKVISGEVAAVISNFHKSIFGENPCVNPALNLHITSFCDHTSEPYESENGLLSQWRGYGASEGYAILFDSKKLYGLLEQENETYHYDYQDFVKVKYDHDKFEFKEYFPGLLEHLAATYRSLREGPSSIPPKVVDLYLHAASSFKHRGFAEEREVRIVSCPVSKSNSGYYEGAGFSMSEKERKIFCERKGNKIIELFSGRLKEAIVKIIIGPGMKKIDANGRVREIRNKFGGDFDVKISETPYVVFKNKS